MRIINNSLTHNSKLTLHEFIYSILIFLYLMLIEDAFFANKIEGRYAYLVQIIIIIICTINIIIFRKKIRLNEVRHYTMYLIPYIILILYSLVLSFVKTTVPLTNIIVTGLYWIIPIFLAFSIYLSMESNSIRVTYNVILLNYSIVIGKTVLTKGLSFVLDVNNYIGGSGGWLEVHMIGLVLPLFLLYFIFLKVEYNIPIGKSFWVGVIFSFMGAKRIAFLAFLITSLTFIILRKIKKKTKSVNTIIICLSLLLILLSFLYIVLLKNGIISLFVKNNNINTMTRIETWDAFSQYYSVSPFFEGNGIGFCMYRLSVSKGIMAYGYYQKIGDLHNDILKIYIESGFVFFFVFFFFLYYVNLKYLINRKYKKTSVLYFLISLYLFVLMTTDNILRYPLFLLVIYIVPSVSQKYENDSLRS